MGGEWESVSEGWVGSGQVCVSERDRWGVGKCVRVRDEWVVGKYVCVRGEWGVCVMSEGWVGGEWGSVCE